MNIRFLTKHIEMKGIEMENYMSPSCQVMEMETEGVLCASDWSGSIGHDGISGSDDDILNK